MTEQQGTAQRALRALLPAPAAATDTTDQSSPTDGTSKDAAVAGACEPCRRRKTKCDGARPVCGKCAARKIECVYIAHLTPRLLRRRLDDVEEELHSHRELFWLMQSRPEEDAYEIFRRVRRGHDVDALLRHVRDGELLADAATAAKAMAEMRYRCGHTLFPLQDRFWGSLGIKETRQVYLLLCCSGYAT
ncbi:transcriptional regulatory protein GAL4 [Microdochium nivale]|nr:transcriptional regulatory protein GAL4 [Microdochium nivale]